MADSAEQLRENIQEIDSTKYAPSVMQNKALLMYAEEELDSFFDIDENHIPFISYLRAINEHLPIPGTMSFIKNQLSLSRSKNRRGRHEFGQALNKQPVILPGNQGINLSGLMQQEEKPGLLSRIFKRKRDEENV